MTWMFTFDVFSLDATWRRVCSASGTAIIGQRTAPPCERRGHVERFKFCNSSTNVNTGEASLVVSLSRSNMRRRELALVTLSELNFLQVPSVFDIGSDLDYVLLGMTMPACVG